MRLVISAGLLVTRVDQVDLRNISRARHYYILPHVECFRSLRVDVWLHMPLYQYGEHFQEIKLTNEALTRRYLYIVCCIWALSAGT